MASYTLGYDPTLLLTFLAVADAGKVSAAAKLLHLSQPAVTGQMRRLEVSLGLQLFARSVKGVALTPQGQRLYDRARAIHTLLTEAAQEITQDRSPRGELNIAASTTIASHLVPAAFAQFQKRFPDVTLNLSVGNTQEVLEQVSGGQAPLGLVEGFGKASHVRLEPYLEDELVLVARTGFSGALKQLSQLKRYPVLWREQGSGSRAIVERALMKSGWKKENFNYSFQLGSTEAIKSAVVAGLGLAFLSHWSIRNELALGQLKILPLTDFRLARKFNWVLPSGHLARPAFDFYGFANANKA